MTNKDEAMTKLAETIANCPDDKKHDVQVFLQGCISMLEIMSKSTQQTAQGGHHG